MFWPSDGANCGRAAAARPWNSKGRSISCRFPPIAAAGVRPEFRDFARPDFAAGRWGHRLARSAKPLHHGSVTPDVPARRRFSTGARGACARLSEPTPTRSVRASPSRSISRSDGNPPLWPEAKAHQPSQAHQRYSREFWKRHSAARLCISTSSILPASGCSTCAAQSRLSRLVGSALEESAKPAARKRRAVHAAWARRSSNHPRPRQRLPSFRLSREAAPIRRSRDPAARPLPMPGILPSRPRSLRPARHWARAVPPQLAVGMMKAATRPIRLCRAAVLSRSFRPLDRQIVPSTCSRR